MQVPVLKITQNPTRIGMNIKNSEIKVKKQMDSVEINSNKAGIKIEKKNAKVKVNNYPAYYDLGYKNIKDVTLEIAGQGKDSAAKATTHYAQSGDKLADFKNNDIVDIIKEEFAADKKEVGLKFKRGPEYDVEKGGLKIKYRQGYIETASNIKKKINRPHINAKYGRVDTYLKQQADINISVKGNLDLKV